MAGFRLTLIRWTRPAAHDLTQICDYIEKQQQYGSPDDDPGLETRQPIIRISPAGAARAQSGDPQTDDCCDAISCSL